MNIFKFMNYVSKIICLFSYLPKGLQEEAVDDMENLYELCLISKLNYLKEVNNEV